PRDAALAEHRTTVRVKDPCKGTPLFGLPLLQRRTTAPRDRFRCTEIRALSHIRSSPSTDQLVPGISRSRQMELLAQQPLGKANNSTGASKDKAEQARVASVAETGLDAAAVGREEEEECGAKGQGMSD
ncbi:unnamed protein product, partial [Laminaria digitata]